MLNRDTVQANLPQIPTYAITAIFSVSHSHNTQKKLVEEQFPTKSSSTSEDQQKIKSYSHK